MQIGKRRTMPNLTPAGEPATADLSTMARQAEAWEPSITQRLAGILQGVSKDDLVAQHTSRETAGREAADRARLVSGLGDRERLAFYANPEQWGGRVAENVGAHQVSAGNTLVRPGFGITVAPKLTEEGGVYGTQTVGDWQKTGARPLGAPEAADLAVTGAKMDLEREKLDALEGYRAGQLGLGAQKVAIARAKAGKWPAVKPGAAAGPKPWQMFGGR